MRVINGGLQGLQHHSVKHAKGTTPAAETGASSGSGATSIDKVTLSSRAKELADQAAAADAQKVNGLRDAIQNGSFKINPQLIAKRIVDGE